MAAAACASTSGGADALVLWGAHPDHVDWLGASASQAIGGLDRSRRASRRIFLLERVWLALQRSDNNRLHFWRGDALTRGRRAWSREARPIFSLDRRIRWPCDGNQIHGGRRNHWRGGAGLLD